MLHHCLSHSARKYTTSGSGEWWGLMVANRILHFAVPLFLLVSALLLARSLAKDARPDWGKFFVNRGRRTLQPYLVWSVAYLAFRLFVVRMEMDLLPATMALPFGLTSSGPNLLFDLPRLGRDLLWGDAYFHLYFMSLMLQMAVLFPAVFYLLRWLKPSFGMTVATAFGLQVGCLLLQRSYGFLAAPASTALWYLPAILIGAWLGLNWQSWTQTWKSWRASISFATLIGFGGYLGCSILILKGAQVSSLLYNSSFVVFSTGIALMLLQGAKALAGRPIARPLLVAGNLSIALFLVHPMVMYLLSGPRITSVLSELPLSPLWAVGLVTACTYALVWCMIRLGWDALLFGRALRPVAKPAPVARPVPQSRPQPLPQALFQVPAQPAPVAARPAPVAVIRQEPVVLPPLRDEAPVEPAPMPLT